jgi:hypothetical protein
MQNFHAYVKIFSNNLGWERKWVESGLVQFVVMKIPRMQRYARFVGRTERNLPTMLSLMKKTAANKL